MAKNTVPHWLRGIVDSQGPGQDPCKKPVDFGHFLIVFAYSPTFFQGHVHYLLSYFCWPYLMSSFRNYVHRHVFTDILKNVGGSSHLLWATKLPYDWLVDILGFAVVS